MMAGFWSGWSIARESLAVLRHYPRLAIFPILSGVAFLLVAALLGASLLPQSGPLHAVAAPIWQRLGAEDANELFVYATGFALVYALTAIAIFFNVALVHSALRALAGEEPSVRAGIAAALTCLPQILGWALVAATVGVLLKVIESVLSEKLGFIAQFIMSFFELAWSVVTYFVLPVLAAEKVGPITALRRSSQILRSKWGESLAGEMRFGLIGLLFFLQAALVFFIGLAIYSSSGGAGAASLGVLLMGLGVIYGLAIMIVLQALSTIFQAGLYVYATTGRIPTAFDAPVLERAFSPKT